MILFIDGGDEQKFTIIPILKLFPRLKSLVLNELDLEKDLAVVRNT